VRPLDILLSIGEISSEEKREVTPSGSVGIASPREKRQGPPSIPGASLILAYRYSPRASIVPLTCPCVSSYFSHCSRTHPAHSPVTALVIMVCNPSAGQSYWFWRRMVERRYGGPIAERGRGEPPCTSTHQIPPLKADIWPTSMQHNSCGIDMLGTCQSRARHVQSCTGSALAHPVSEEYHGPSVTKQQILV
jgi:hypothetical protein